MAEVTPTRGGSSSRTSTPSVRRARSDECSPRPPRATDSGRPKSIGEIIGWVPCGDFGWQSPDVDWSDGSPPNIDDMLAWLRSQCVGRDQILINVAIAPETMARDGRGAYLVRVIPGLHSDPWTNHYGHTLREAVESMVRAVAIERRTS